MDPRSTKSSGNLPASVVASVCSFEVLIVVVVMAAPLVVLMVAN